MTVPRPAWMTRLQNALAHPDPEYFDRFQPPDEGGVTGVGLDAMLFAEAEVEGVLGALRQ